MAWVRDGEPPEQIKVSFVVSAKEHPELARFIWTLPYRGTSQVLRDVLSSAVKKVGVGEVGKSQAPVARAPEGGGGETAVSTEVLSDAVAGIIGDFDKMFPSSQE